MRNLEQISPKVHFEPPLWDKLPPVLRQNNISDPSYERTQTSPLVFSLQLFHSKLKKTAL